MSETKIQVPEGMLKAIGTAPNVCHCSTCESGNEERLKSALRWLSENPIVPSEADVMEILQERVESHHISGKEYCAIPPATVRFVIRESQRRMFLAPEPEVPSEIRDIDAWLTVYLGSHPEIENIRRNFLLTFRRGQQSK